MGLTNKVLYGSMVGGGQTYWVLLMGIQVRIYVAYLYNILSLKTAPVSDSDHCGPTIVVPLFMSIIIILRANWSILAGVMDLSNVF
mgnify:CR=1 FL=1